MGLPTWQKGLRMLTTANSAKEHEQEDEGGRVFFLYTFCTRSSSQTRS
jgi:hypothetical protein